MEILDRIEKLIDHFGVCIVLPGSNHLPGVALRFEFNQQVAVLDRDPVDACSIDLDDVSSPLSAVASVLRKSIETENEGGQSDCDSQQNKGGSRLQVRVQELPNFRSCWSSGVAK